MRKVCISHARVVLYRSLSGKTVANSRERDSCGYFDGLMRCGAYLYVSSIEAYIGSQCSDKHTMHDARLSQTP
jgi:hypothetical protein